VSKSEVAIGEADHEVPAGRIAPTGNGPTVDTASLEQELDRVSLTQALIDTEAATARVIDLTERLIDARTQINDLRKEIDALRIEHHELRDEHEAMQQSAAYRLATSIWNIRNALRL